jgi:hypothetical protein
MNLSEVHRGAVLAKDPLTPIDMMLEVLKAETVVLLPLFLLDRLERCEKRSERGVTGRELAHLGREVSMEFVERERLGRMLLEENLECP